MTSFGRDGTIYTGRPESAVPDTATTYDPTGHLTICLLGDFDQQQSTDAQIDALVSVASWLLRRYGLPPSVLGGRWKTSVTFTTGALSRTQPEGTLSGIAISVLLLYGRTRAAARLNLARRRPS